MRKSVRQVAMVLGISTLLVGYAQGTTFDDTQDAPMSSAVVVDKDSEMTELPHHEPLSEESVKCLELMCPGKCALGAGDNSFELQIDNSVLHASMVENKNGSAVFTNPKSMCAVRMPSGHRGRMIVTVDKIKAPFQRGKRHYLQISRGGRFFAAISCAGYRKTRSVDVENGQLVEFFPRLSSGDCSRDEYKPVEIGAKVTAYNSAGHWGIGAVPVDGEVDFGAEYRVRVQCRPLNDA